MMVNAPARAGCCDTFPSRTTSSSTAAMDWPGIAGVRTIAKLRHRPQVRCNRRSMASLTPITVCRCLGGLSSYRSSKCARPIGMCRGVGAGPRGKRGQQGGHPPQGRRSTHCPGAWCSSNAFLGHAATCNASAVLFRLRRKEEHEQRTVRRRYRARLPIDV